MRKLILLPVLLFMLLIPTVAQDGGGGGAFLQEDSFTVFDVYYEYETSGIRHSFDMVLEGRVDEDLSIVVWFKDAETGDYITNPYAPAKYRNSNNVIHLLQDFHKQSFVENYSPDDFSFLMPYEVFPGSRMNYTLEVSIHDAELNTIYVEYLTDTVIAVDGLSVPESGVLIRDLGVTFDDTGINLNIDLTADNLPVDDYSIYVFFLDYNAEFIQNAIPIEDYYQLPNGAIASVAELDLCCGSRVNLNDIELFVPFNAFPNGSYYYYPVIAVYLDGNEEAIEFREFEDMTIEVMGNERPVGYIVNFELDSLYIHQTFNAYIIGTPYHDQLMISYSLSQLDAGNNILSGDQGIWVDAVANGPQQGDQQRLLVDVQANNRLAMRYDFVDVVDLDGYRNARDALKQGRRVASQAAKSLTPRLFRAAARGALRYTNGFLLLYDIFSLFEEDQHIDSYERIFTPDELYALYQASGPNEWETVSFSVGGPGYENGHNYEVDSVFSLHGYFRHQLVGN